VAGAADKMICPFDTTFWAVENEQMNTAIMKTIFLFMYKFDGDGKLNVLFFVLLSIVF
jgi:hypothetical protein